MVERFKRDLDRARQERERAAAASSVPASSPAQSVQAVPSPGPAVSEASKPPIAGRSEELFTPEAIRDRMRGGIFPGRALRAAQKDEELQASSGS